MMQVERSEDSRIAESKILASRTFRIQLHIASPLIVWKLTFLEIWKIKINIRVFHLDFRSLTQNRDFLSSVKGLHRLGSPHVLKLRKSGPLFCL